jgi:hypothetical protein
MKHVAISGFIANALVLLTAAVLVLGGYFVARENLVDSGTLFPILVIAFGLSALPGWLRR